MDEHSKKIQGYLVSEQFILATRGEQLLVQVTKIGLSLITKIGRGGRFRSSCPLLCVQSTTMTEISYYSMFINMSLDNLIPHVSFQHVRP